MAIANDWYIDYYNKVICHSTTTIDYNTQTANFNVGALLTGASSTQTAVIVNDTDGGVTGTLDLVYITGTFTNGEIISDNGTTAGSALYTASTQATKTTTYTTRALYSFLQDKFDELVQLDDTVPMSAQTPTEFTLINAWFVDDESVKFLTGGALSTSGYDTAIQLITLQSGATSAVNSDVGKTVTDDAVDVGALLHFNNTTRKWWVRGTSTVAAASAMLITSGTGVGTSHATNASTSGEDTYTNIYTLGTIATDPKPETYVFQNSGKINSWWSRGNATAHIDVLIKVYEMDDGATDDGMIGDGTITVFARNYADLYDHFNIDLKTGGRKAVPLASAADLNNNTTGEGYLLYTGSTTYTVGDILTDGTSSATAEILVVTDWTGTGLLALGHIKGTFGDSNTITDETTGTAAVNGTIGYSYSTYSGETGGGFAVSDTVTGAASGATGTLRGLQDDGTTGKLVIEPTNYLDYSLAENLEVSASTRGVAATAATRSVVAYDDVSIWFVNESVTTSAISTDYTEGEIVYTGIASDNESRGIYLYTDATTAATGTMHIANITSSAFTSGETITGSTSGATCSASADAISDYQLDKAFTQGNNNPYSIIIDCAGRYMSEVYEWLKYTTREDANETDQTNAINMYPVVSGAVVTEDGEEYIYAQTTYSPVKASPFGTFAGGKFFAARGVWVQNMHNDDIQAFQLIDSSGSTQTPPNFQTITISNLVSGDRVMVARTSSGSIINKDVFSLATAAISSTSVIIDSPTAIPSDTPDAGYLRVVDVSDTSINRESRYSYSAWSGATFSIDTSTHTTGITRAIDTADTAYVPYIDTSATTDSESVTVIYSSDRTVVARIRRYNGTVDSILPFETTGTFNSTGYSAVTIRTPDTIVT